MTDRYGSLRTVSPLRNVPGWTTMAFAPRSRSSRPRSELASRSAALPKRALNLAQPVCGSWLNLMMAEPRLTRDPAAGSPLRCRDHVDLVARLGPAIGPAGDGLGIAGVHERDLREPIGTIGAQAGAVDPGVADEPDLGIEFAFGDDFAVIWRGAPHDEADEALVMRRLLDQRQSGTELFGGLVSHAAEYAPAVVVTSS